MSRFQQERHLAQKLNGLTRRWRMIGDQTLARLGVSNATGWCLVYLNRLGDDARQSDLARVVGVREATLVRTLTQLETAGLVERFPNPRDARANLMRLTPRGEEVVSQIEGLLTQLRRDALQDVNDDDLAAAVRVVDAIEIRLAEKLA